MALPWLIGLGGIYAAKKIYDAVSEDDYDDEEDEEEDLRKKERKRKKKLIKQDIKAYKEEKKDEIRRRFDAEIDFINKREVEVISINTKNTQEYEIKNIELEQALKDLQYFKEDYDSGKEWEMIKSDSASNEKIFDLYAKEAEEAMKDIKIKANSLLERLAKLQ